MVAKYTFFEVSTQKGHLAAVFGELLPRHWIREILSAPNGSKYKFVARRYDYEEPLFEVEFDGRGPRESSVMWQRRVREEAITAWEKFQDRRRTAKAASAGQVGADKLKQEAEARRQQEAADAALLARLLGSDGASSTPSPTESKTSSSATAEADLAKSGSGPSGPTTPNSVISPTSTHHSKPASPKKGSKSPSSSGGSMGSTSAGTERAGST